MLAKVQNEANLAGSNAKKARKMTPGLLKSLTNDAQKVRIGLPKVSKKLMVWLHCVLISCYSEGRPSTKIYFSNMSRKCSEKN